MAIALVFGLFALYSAKRVRPGTLELDDMTLSDEDQPFAEYYSQVFRPVAAGYDYRSLAPPDLLPDIPFEQITASSSSDSDASFTELNGTTAIWETEAEVECDVCRWAVQWIAHRCCVGSGHETKCNFNVPGCAQWFYLRNMYNSAKVRYKDSFECTFRTCKHFGWSTYDRARVLRRVWADLTAVGTVLNKYETKQQQGGKSDLQIAGAVCKEAVTETFDCKRQPALNNNAVAHSDHRDEICKGPDPPGGPPVGWRSWSFCSASGGTEEGGKYHPQGNVLDRSQEKLHPTNETIDFTTSGLGFPEHPLSYDGASWKVRSHTSHDAAAATYINNILNSIPAFKQPDMGKVLDGTLRWKKMDEYVRTKMSTYLIQAKLIVILHRRAENDGGEGTWFVENIPPGNAFKGLYALYSPGKAWGHTAAQWLLTLNNLQSIGWSRGAASGEGYWSAEDAFTKRAKIEKYMEHYEADLKEVDMGNVSPGENLLEKAIETFQTFNHFFFRKLRLGTRKFMCYDVSAGVCAERVDKERRKKKTLVSPADSKLIAYSDYSVDPLHRDTFWVKGEAFLLRNMVSFPHDANYYYYEGGTLMIFRLAPQDYHRFHFPVDGKIAGFENYPGNAYSVNPIAVNNDSHTPKWGGNGKRGTDAWSTSSPVFTTNKRMHTTIDTGEENFGCVLYISVGATNVASVMHTSYVGQNVVRGMEHGYMAFGGSTVIVVVRKGVMHLDNDIAVMSQKPVETIMKLGDHVGSLKGKDHVNAPLQGSSPCRGP